MRIASLHLGWHKKNTYCHPFSERRYPALLNVALVVTSTNRMFLSKWDFIKEGGERTLSYDRLRRQQLDVIEGGREKMKKIEL